MTDARTAARRPPTRPKLSAALLRQFPRMRGALPPFSAPAICRWQTLTAEQQTVLGSLLILYLSADDDEGANQAAALLLEAAQRLGLLAPVALDGEAILG